MTYSYDANGNVTATTQLLGPSTFAYDALDRLTDETITGVAYQASYDANGNRLSSTAPGFAVAIGYEAASNRLGSLTVNAIPEAVSLDAAGNLLTLRNGDATLSYTGANRLGQVTYLGAPLAAYTYNHAGLRTRKATPAGTLVYHYDQSGQLLLETTDAGIPLRSYLWLDNTPLAQIDLTPTGPSLSYLHTDHLNTPRAASNAAGTVVWRWAGEAFGSTDPLEDPDGDTLPTVVNLRFPGQYFDAETGLHYAGTRYYDPRLGRFITADTRSVGKHVELMLDHVKTRKLLNSIGVTLTPDVNQPPLEINPYAYVGNNPLRWTDPTGESIGWPGAVVIVGGACFTAYCAIQAKNYCEAAYPSSGGLENDRKRVKCASERLKFCVTFGMYIMDPIGEGAKTIGEEVGKQTCDECKH